MKPLGKILNIPGAYPERDPREQLSVSKSTSTGWRLPKRREKGDARCGLGVKVGGLGVKGFRLKVGEFKGGLQGGFRELKGGLKGVLKGGFRDLGTGLQFQGSEFRVWGCGLGLSAAWAFKLTG